MKYGTHLAHRTYSNFMGDVSVAAKLDNKYMYLAHYVQATAFQHIDNAGFEARHYMLMSGRMSEVSIRSYNRSCFNHQKNKSVGMSFGINKLQLQRGFHVQQPDDIVTLCLK